MEEYIPCEYIQSKQEIQPLKVPDLKTYVDVTVIH